MVVGNGTNRLAEKQDLVYLVILLAVALVIGTHLIFTTVLISKDGVSYIEWAQELSANPRAVIKGHPFGYPFLIFIAHKFAALFLEGNSVFTWIWSAQWVALLCRLLALVPLYFLGRLFIGPWKSFCAVLILVILPYPAKFGSDVLRDWPHILFLVAGFLLLVSGSKNSKWWFFGLAGLLAGLGYLIRPECAQLVVYGACWLLIRLFVPKPEMSRARLTCALLFLLIGFAVPVVPYSMVRGRFLPARFKTLISSSGRAPSDTTDERHVGTARHICAGLSVTGNVLYTVGRLIEQFSGSLMHFFLPALLVGIHSRFRKKSDPTVEERFFVTAFVILNILMMLLLCCQSGYISKRHCLPLVVLTIFYVPAGLHILGEWIGTLFSRCVRKPCWAGSAKLASLYVLLVGSLVTCLPRLIRPIHLEKQGYRDAAEWLTNNTAKSDIITVPDRRISFYAEREGYLYGNKVFERFTYALKIMGDENEEPNLGRPVQKKYSVLVDKRKKRGKKLVIYRML